MALWGVVGQNANSQIIAKALRCHSLLIDAQNCANVHRIPAELELLANVELLQAESLYRFIPTLKLIPKFKDKELICISTFHRLFNYQDVQENEDVIEYAWELIHEYSKEQDIIVAIHDSQEQFISKYNITLMGHTNTSQRMQTDIILKELESFAKTLRPDERQIFLRMLKRPLKHLGSISNASSYHTWAFIILSILLEQEKRGNNERISSGRLDK